jgi:hypothetical protein
MKTKQPVKKKCLNIVTVNVTVRGPEYDDLIAKQYAQRIRAYFDYDTEGLRNDMMRAKGYGED